MRWLSAIGGVVLTAACGTGVLTNPVHTPGDATSGGTSSGGSGGGSTSSGGGTTTGLPPTNDGCYDGGSFPEISEFQDCYNDNGNCPCPLACVFDADFGPNQYPCEYLCDEANPYCDDTSTYCVQGICRVDFCQATNAGEPRPGVLGGLCAAVLDGPSDSGTCMPWTSVIPGLPIVGNCVQGGNLVLGQRCDQSGDNPFSRSGRLCGTGMICTGSGCAPLGPGGCLAPNAVYPGLGDHHGCDNTANCACPLVCVQQQDQKTPLCEALCADGGSCPNPRTCRGGYCD